MEVLGSLFSLVLTVIVFLIGVAFWRRIWHLSDQLDALLEQGKAAAKVRAAQLEALRDAAASAPRRPVEADDSFDAAIAAELAPPLPPGQRRR